MKSTSKRPRRRKKSLRMPKSDSQNTDRLAKCRRFAFLRQMIAQDGPNSAGILLSAGLFSGDNAVSNGDALSCAYSVSS
jgi:hypothetical protein